MGSSIISYIYTKNNRNQLNMAVCVALFIFTSDHHSPANQTPHTEDKWQGGGVFPYKSMGTRTITVIEATRCLLYFHEKARRVKFVFCCCCCMPFFNKEPRCCLANAIPNLAASLAVAALAGVSYSGWLLLLLLLLWVGWLSSNKDVN